MTVKTSGLRVLIVDEAEDGAANIADLLRHYGHAVWTVESGLEAIQVMRTERPDAIFLDVGIADLDDVRLARDLTCGTENTPPVIGITVDGRFHDIDEDRAIGVDPRTLELFPAEATDAVLREWRTMPGDDQSREHELARHVKRALKLALCGLAHVAVSVEQDSVRLSGEVGSFFARQLAIESAMRVTGVRRVDDRITVKHRPEKPR